MTRIARASFATPHNREDLDAWIGEAGECQREIALAELACKETIAKVKQNAAAAIAPHQERLNGLVQGITAYAQANRLDLCNDGGKTLMLFNGHLHGATARPRCM